jgi:hypothetical protein
MAPPGGFEGDAINAIRFLAIDAVERAKSGDFWAGSKARENRRCR